MHFAFTRDWVYYRLWTDAFILVKFLWACEWCTLLHTHQQTLIWITANGKMLQCQTFAMFDKPDLYSDILSQFFDLRLAKPSTNTKQMVFYSCWHYLRMQLLRTWLGSNRLTFRSLVRDKMSIWLITKLNICASHYKCSLSCTLYMYVCLAAVIHIKVLIWTFWWEIWQQRQSTIPLLSGTSILELNWWTNSCNRKPWMSDVELFAPI